MKDCKFLRILNALLALFGTIVLFALSVVTALPLLGITVTGIVAQLADGINTAVAQIPFLSSLDAKIGSLIFVCVTFALPFVLLLVATLVLFSKPKKSTAKYVFASIVTIIAVVIFCGIVELFCAALLGEASLAARLSVAGVLALYALLSALLIVLLHKKNKIVEEVAEEQPETIAETDVAEGVPTEQDDDLDVAAEQIAEAMSEVVATSQEVEEEPKPQEKVEITPANEYVPVDRDSISEIVEHTYGTKTAVKSVNMKKIAVARSLLDAGVISKDEYIALVDAYLRDAD